MYDASIMMVVYEMMNDVALLSGDLCMQLDL